MSNDDSTAATKLRVEAVWIENDDFTSGGRWRFDARPARQNPLRRRLSYDDGLAPELIAAIGSAEMLAVPIDAFLVGREADDAAMPRIQLDGDFGQNVWPLRDVAEFANESRVVDIGFQFSRPIGGLKTQSLPTLLRRLTLICVAGDDAIFAAGTNLPKTLRTLHIELRHRTRAAVVAQEGAAIRDDDDVWLDYHFGAARNSATLKDFSVALLEPTARSLNSAVRRASVRVSADFFRGPIAESLEWFSITAPLVRADLQQNNFAACTRLQHLNLRQSDQMTAPSGSSDAPLQIHLLGIGRETTPMLATFASDIATFDPLTDRFGAGTTVIVSDSYVATKTPMTLLWRPGSVPIELRHLKELWVNNRPVLPLGGAGKSRIFGIGSLVRLAPKLAAVLGRLGINKASTAAVLKQAIRLSGTTVSPIAGLML
jgi:hypothetical protein